MGYLSVTSLFIVVFQQTLKFGTLGKTITVINSIIKHFANKPSPLKQNHPILSKIQTFASFNDNTLHF